MDQFSKTSIYDFVRRLDKKRDGFIDFEEFSYGFEVLNTSFSSNACETAFSRSVSQEDIPWIKETCEKIGFEVKSVENLRNLFEKFGMKKVGFDVSKA